MITHYAHLQLPTVSIQGVRQFYHEQLGFPISMESEDEIVFQSTEFFTLTFVLRDEALHPAHFAWEIPHSTFENSVLALQEAGITLLKWPDGRITDDFLTGKNVYFRDGEGNLLELIAHSYVEEDVVVPNGKLKLLYLREIGFPVDDVVDFRETLVQLFDFKLDKVSDNFAFAIGGTAHAVIPSKKRKWIPIAMSALQPAMTVIFGVSSVDDLLVVKKRLISRGIPYELEGETALSFKIKGYPVKLVHTVFPADVPERLHLPFAIEGNK